MAIKIFGRTRKLINEIDEFLNILSETSLIFREGIGAYLDQGPSEQFLDRLKQVADGERRADELRRNIQRDMYAETLMPDARGDILGLLESLDGIINQLGETLWNLASEKPVIPEDLRETYRELLDPTVAATEALVLASRAFFRNVGAIGDHLHKVHFYESEADVIIGRLKDRTFASDRPLADKLQLKAITESLAAVSDLSEDTADQLTIYAIKRAT
jgi:predicted phosphate transport protein (TIGR00153 family)